ALRNSRFPGAWTDRRTRRHQIPASTDQQLLHEREEALDIPRLVLTVQWPEMNQAIDAIDFDIVLSCVNLYDANLGIALAQTFGEQVGDAPPIVRNDEHGARHVAVGGR